MLICPSCKKPTRVGVRRNDAGKNNRFCKECDADIPQGEL
jgi:large subunit ribosomal protein L24